MGTDHYNDTDWLARKGNQGQIFCVSQRFGDDYELRHGHFPMAPPAEHLKDASSTAVRDLLTQRMRSKLSDARSRPKPASAPWTDREKADLEKLMPSSWGPTQYIKKSNAMDTIFEKAIKAFSDGGQATWKNVSRGLRHSRKKEKQVSKADPLAADATVAGEGRRLSTTPYGLLSPADQLIKRFHARQRTKPHIAALEKLL